jgi:beta-lactamase regulating signal transducer with metallopeptidase domain
MTEVSLVVRATAILLVCFAVLRLSRRRAAALRALILTFTFGMLLLLPVAVTVLPAIRVANPFTKAGAAVPRILGRVAPAPVAVAIVARATAPTPTRAATWSTATVLMLIWAAGSVSFAAPVFATVWGATRVRRRSMRWTRGESMARTVLESRGTGRSPDVVRLEGIAAPFTFGIGRPTIVFPTDANEWSHDDLWRALVHEIEHIRRADCVVLLGSRLVCALYWFHPLAWAAWRRLRLEIERACDDAVIRGCDPSAYAEQLVALASRLSARTPVPLLSMASRSDLASRIVSMLDGAQRRNSPAGLPRLLTLAAAVVLLVGVAATRVASMPGQSSDSARRLIAPEKNNLGQDVRIGGASVSGYLYDPFGNPLDGIVLDIEWMSLGLPLPGERTQGPFVRNTTTDATGHFSFDHLRPGYYGLAAPRTDFVPPVNLSLSAGEHVDRDIHMKLEPLTGSFTVCKECTVRSDTYVLPDSIAKEFDLDAQDALTQPVTGPEPAAGWLGAHQSIPEYPESLRNTTLEGTVIVEGKIGIDGIRTAMRVVSAPYPELAKAAVAMLSEEVWKPAYVRGVPVEVPFREQIDFVLRLRGQ